MNILSIQSAVAYGHVGNAAAVFPLQRLGAEVWPIDTVHFSNHPGYGAHTGEVVAPAAIAALLDGIEARGALVRCDALLTGYIGDEGNGGVTRDAADRVRAANPAALWCCDPVMGDQAPGLYVRTGIPAFFRDRAVPAADLLTPNLFELAHLTGLPCGTLADVRAAAAALQHRMRASGPRAVLVTSVQVEDTPADALDLLVVAPDGCHRLRTPLLPMSPNGAGDIMAALFLFHILRGGSASAAMANAAASVHGILRRTLEAGSRELLLIEAQEELLTPTRRFTPEPC